MDNYTFPELIWAVAMLMWPICILIIAILFKKDISKLISNKHQQNKLSNNADDIRLKESDPANFPSSSKAEYKSNFTPKKDLHIEDDLITVEVCQNLKSDLYFIFVEEINESEATLIIPTGEIKTLKLTLFSEIEEKSIHELLKQNLITKKQLSSFEKYINCNANKSIQDYLKNPKKALLNEPAYVNKYRKSLQNTDTIPSRMLDYIERKKKASWSGIKSFLTNEYGYRDSGSFSASLRVLLVDGFINIDGQGDNKIISIATKDKRINDMVYLKFGTPQDVTNSGHDGMKIKFPFQVIEPGKGARRDKVTEHSIIVDIVGTMLATWGLGRSGSDSQSVMPYLFEYARKAAVEKLVVGSLAQCHEISVHGANESYQNPFDPNKLTKPDGAIYEIDIAEAREMHRLKQMEKRGLGFKFKE